MRYGLEIYFWIIKFEDSQPLGSYSKELKRKIPLPCDEASGLAI